MRRSKRRRLCKERRQKQRINITVQWLQAGLGILPLIRTLKKEEE